MEKTMSGDSIARYSPAAQWFHWLTFLFVSILVPAGIIMADRGARNIWDSVTNNLYSTHKLAGFTLLWIVLLRLAYRLFAGAPAPEPTLKPWQRVVSALNHWALYALLVIMPLLGWLGVSMFPALDIFGLFNLPSIASKNEDLSKRILGLHETLAWVLIALVALHIAAALYHAVIRKDGVLRRMLSL
jgi:cytochrome b561